MTTRLHDRWYALCGIAFVVLELGGAFLAMGTGKTHDLTDGSSTSAIATAIAHPVGAGVWAGAYLELLSVGFFLAFAVWAAERLGGGLLGSLMRVAAAASAGGTIVALAIGDIIAYRAGNGLSLDVAKVLVTGSEAVYVATWFINATFLAAAGLLALRSSRRVLGWWALVAVAYTLVLTPIAVNTAGQFSQFLYVLWIVAASVALLRGQRQLARRAELAPGV